MTSATRYSAYDMFAHINNEAWGTPVCHSLMPIIEQLLLKQILPGGKILDVCCGSGQIVQKLQEKGYQLTGLDGSEEMLKYAKINAPDSEFLLEDARFFHLPSRFDGVISTHYGFNHILSIEELKSVFQNVYAALRPNGWFMFDLSLNERYRGSWHNSMQGDVQTEYAWALKRIYNSETRIGNIYITVFELTEQNWQRSDQTWQVKGYVADEVISALQEVGFKAINLYSGEQDFSRMDEQGIIYVICHKPV